jgi:hypothetical protein
MAADVFMPIDEILVYELLLVISIPSLLILTLLYEFIAFIYINDADKSVVFILSVIIISVFV